MGYPLYKPAPEKNLYVLFSSNTDYPICWGTAENFLKWAIADEYTSRHYDSLLFGERFYKRLIRADEHPRREEEINWAGHGTIKVSDLPKILKELERIVGDDEELGEQHYSHPAILVMVTPHDWE